MTTSDVERRLGEVLRQHAEDAMEHTDTQTRLETLEHGIDRDHRRRSRSRIVVAVGLAASVALGALLVGTSEEERGNPAPAGPTRGDEDTLVAERFLDRLAAYDLEGATTYLTDDAYVGLSSLTQDRAELLRQVLWSSAAGFQIVSSECAEQSGFVVRCQFEYHALGSAQLGLGPYGHNTFRITVKDGLVVSAMMVNAYEVNGFAEEMWKPFAEWVSRKHPDDAAVMYADWPDTTTQAMGAQSRQLWAERVKDYVDKYGEECACPQ